MVIPIIRQDKPPPPGRGTGRKTFYRMHECKFAPAAPAKTTMQLDIRTLIINLLLFALVFAIGIFLLQRSQPRLRALRWWSGAIIAAGAGFLLLSLRDSIPDFLSVVVANDLMLLALCLFLEGVVVFRGLPRGYVWRISAPLIAILTLLLLYFTYAEASVAARIIAVSLTNAVPVALAAWLLIRDIPRPMRFSHYFTAAGFIQFAVVSVGRIAHTLISPPADLMTAGPMQAATFLSIFFLLVVSSFGCVWMVSAYLAEELEQQARTDPLTGVLNRLALDETLARELSRARRGKHALSLLMFDLDHFKALNDRLGHQAGDMALRSVAAATQQQLRATDLLARFGGEEFVVVLPDTDKAHAIETAQRLRKRVGALGIDRGDGASLTASYGVSTFPEDGDDQDSLVGRADATMYAAKQAGRNCVSASVAP